MQRPRNTRDPVITPNLADDQYRPMTQSWKASASMTSEKCVVDKVRGCSFPPGAADLGITHGPFLTHREGIMPLPLFLPPIFSAVFKQSLLDQLIQNQVQPLI